MSLKMKKIGIFLLSVAAGIFIGFAVNAAPYLTSDPYPAGSEDAIPTSFILEFDGGQPIEIPALQSDGKVMVKYDLISIPVGTHTVRGKAKNKWGESEWSAPFVFTKAIPAVPSGIGLSE